MTSSKWFTSLATALVLSAIAPRAEARSVTGYESYTPWPSQAGDGCVNDDWGAALNNCGVPKLFLFNTSIESAGIHRVNIAAGPLGSGYFSCQAHTVSQTGELALLGSRVTFNFAGPQVLTSVVNVPSGWSLRVSCGDVAPGREIASLVYNP